MSIIARRKATVQKCDACGEPVLVGLSGERAALTIIADVFPLSIHGEVEALRAGRFTYQVFWQALDLRDQFNIPGATAEEITVVTDHRCDQPLPKEWRRKALRPNGNRVPTEVEVEF